MKRVAPHEHPAVVSVPEVVRVAVVAVEPATIVVVFDVEHVEVVVRVADYVRYASCVPPFEYSRGCVVFGIYNALA